MGWDPSSLGTFDPPSGSDSSGSESDPDTSSVQSESAEWDADDTETSSSDESSAPSVPAPASADPPVPVICKGRLCETVLTGVELDTGLGLCEDCAGTDILDVAAPALYSDLLAEDD